MKRFKLVRVSYTTYGTFGVLLEETEGFDIEREELPIAVTLENPWIDNLPRVSCIPVGLYKCKRVNSPRFGDTFEITDVYGRTHILFHKGNTEVDTLGCVIVATSYGHLSGTPAVLQSNPAFNSFMKKLEGHDEFELAIIDVA